jgi:serine protease AprX
LLVIASVVALVSLTLFTGVFGNKSVLSRVLMRELSSNGPTFDIVVYLKPGLPDQLLNNKKKMDSDERARFIHQHLVRVSSSSQAALLKDLNMRLLSSSSAQKIESFVVNRLWISNAIVMHNVSKEVIYTLEKHPLVKRIISDRAFKVDLEKPETMEPGNIDNSTASVQWNIEWIQAPKMWALGFEGQGITVANADTGVQASHPALLTKYRGYNGQGQPLEHNYNWWDAIKEPITKPGHSSCGYNTQQPCDDHGHGTHCMGTELGDSAPQVPTIGVAPKANFIACRNMDAGLGRPSTYIGCMQFFLAPTDLQGNNPDSDKRPHVVSNSYGCTKSELCEEDSLLEAVKALKAAGVFMAVANGNSGPSCATTSDPPGLYADVFSIGALGYKTDKIAAFSSRGPSLFDNVTKPDLSAPGTNILSSTPNNRYASMSGTSMATPHVAGAVALLWQAVPELKRNIEATEAALEKGAKPMVDDTCGSDGSNPIPNNVYGYGGMNIHESYQHAKSIFANRR